MNNLAKKIEEEPVYQTFGTVIRVEGEVFVVRAEEIDLRVRRAVSCLVLPELHDYVLVGGQGKSGYVLAVLEREAKNAAWVCEGRLDIRAGESATLSASEDINIVTPKAVNLLSEEFALNASRAKLVASELIAIGTHVVGELGQVALKGTFLDKVFERVTERVQRSFRRVDEIDQLKAKQIDYMAEQTLCLRSDNMVAVAKELVKVDGEQIHFG